MAAVDALFELCVDVHRHLAIGVPDPVAQDPTGTWFAWSWFQYDGYGVSTGAIRLVNLTAAAPHVPKFTSPLDGMPSTPVIASDGTVA